MKNNNTLALFGGSPILKKPLPPYDSLGKEERAAVLKVMDGKLLSGFLGRAGGRFLGGPYVKKLEKRFTDYFNVKHAVSFNSATTALQGALCALGVGPGDEVITSPYTMSATSSVILMQNALPVFADIEENTFCLDPKSIEKCITKKTKAILVVNLFGGSADYSPILALAKKHKLFVIEDNAQAIAATYKGKFTGTIGDIGVFSFNVHKVIHSGEGGMLTTNNDAWAFRSQLLRNHGEAVIDDLYDMNETYEPIVGMNYRLTEMQAAIALEQFKKVRMLTEKRIALARDLTRKLRVFSWLIPGTHLPKSTNICYTYPLRFLEEKIGISRKTFVAAMKAEGFALNMGYIKPTYLMPLYQKQEMFPHSRFPFISKEYPHNSSYAKGICPVTERMYEKELLLSDICQPPQTKKDIDSFIQAIKKIEANGERLKAYDKKT